MMHPTYLAVTLVGISNLDIWHIRLESSSSQLSCSFLTRVCGGHVVFWHQAYLAMGSQVMSAFEVWCFWLGEFGLQFWYSCPLFLQHLTCLVIEATLSNNLVIWIFLWHLVLSAIEADLYVSFGDWFSLRCPVYLAIIAGLFVSADAPRGQSVFGYVACVLFSFSFACLVFIFIFYVRLAVVCKIELVIAHVCKVLCWASVITIMIFFLNDAC